MGWDQSYSVEGVDSLRLRLSDIDVKELIQKALDEKGIKVVSEEEFWIDEFYDQKGKKIVLSDGRVFEHKLVRSDRWDDEGQDYYELRPQQEEVHTKIINHEIEYFDPKVEEGVIEDVPQLPPAALDQLRREELPPELL